MKKTLSTLLLLITTFATQVLAQVPAGPGQVPQTLHIQSVLIDDGGNVLYNQQEADILFQIVNAQDQVLYQENQHVYIIKGTMSVLIGEGNDVASGNPTGGIPPSVFDPRTGEKMVRYKLANHTVYSEELRLATVPYSNYAGYALDVASPLNSQQIADGGIEPVDLSQNTIDFLNDTVTNTTRTEFQAHRDQRDAHTARNISINNSFVYIRGSNLQASVESIDATFNLFREYDRQMQTEISNLITDVTALTTTIGGLDARYINTAGDDTMTGSLNMSENNITNVNLVDGVDLEDLRDDVNQLQGRADVPLSERIFSWGSVTPSGVSGFNVGSVQPLLGPTGGMRVFFSPTNSPTNSSYNIQVTHTSFPPTRGSTAGLQVPAACTISQKATNFFDYSCRICDGGGCDFGVPNFDFMVIVQ